MFFKKKKRPSGQPNQQVQAPNVEPSFIGRDTTVEGHIVCEGELHVDGTVRGTVRAQVCVVDVDGVVQGEVSGDVVHVRGRVHGPIQGANVFIHSGAHVEGDVFHDTISIENGAYVYGSIRHNGASSPMAPGRAPAFPVFGSAAQAQPAPLVPPPQHNADYDEDNYDEDQQDPKDRR